MSSSIKSTLYINFLEQFPRTTKPFSLDEVLFILHCLSKNYPIEVIGQMTKRDPNQIFLHFLIRKESLDIEKAFEYAFDALDSACEKAFLKK